MTDRELLELAAKAAGIVIGRYDSEPIGLSAGFNFPNTNVWWNPLTDDGDEARLEAALQMHVAWYPILQTVTVGTAAVNKSEPYGDNRQAARRRAGVRAAAEIGRA